MRASSLLWACVLTAGVSACGGGGGGNSPPEAQPQLTLTTAAIKQDLAVGDELALKVDGRWSFTGPGAVYLQLRDSGSSFSLPAIQVAPADEVVALSVTALPTLPPGKRSGTLELRACKDSACTQLHAGTPAQLAYELNVSAVPDWETHQGNARHSGEVPIRLSPARFSKVWEWQRPAGGEPIGGINPVVTHAGKVYVTMDVYFGEARLYALNEASGSEAWLRSMGSVPAFNPPAVGGGKVYAAVTGHEQTFLWAFDLETGQFQHKSGFTGQWPHYLAPTVVGDQVYQGGGYFGGDVNAYSTADGALKWTSHVGGVWDMYTPAVDAQSVYHHNGAALVVLDKASGKETARINDPFGVESGPSYHGGPLLGSRGNVIAFAGTTTNARASSNVEHFYQRPLSSFVTAAAKYEWSTAHAYLTSPAVGGGMIYAARNDPMALDAIDEATGQVVWSWAPSGSGEASFHRNLVLTKTHLFVSTDRNVHAIDLKTRQSVWTYPAPGMLAISADRTLYIATGARESDGRLVAIRLK